MALPAFKDGQHSLACGTSLQPLLLWPHCLLLLLTLISCLSLIRTLVVTLSPPRQFRIISLSQDPKFNHIHIAPFAILGDIHRLFFFLIYRFLLDIRMWPSLGTIIPVFDYLVQTVLPSCGWEESSKQRRKKSSDWLKLTDSSHIFFFSLFQDIS